MMNFTSGWWKGAGASSFHSYIIKCPSYHKTNCTSLVESQVPHPCGPEFEHCLCLHFFIYFLRAGPTGWIPVLASICSRAGVNEMVR